MNRDDIIRMAREAGFTVCRDEWVLGEMLERFSALVAAEVKREASFDRAELWLGRINKAVAAEREACANDKQDAERYRHMRNNAQFQSRNGPGLYWYLPRFSDGKVRDEGQQLDDAIDAAIRARGQA